MCPFPCPLFPSRYLLTPRILAALLDLSARHALSYVQQTHAMSLGDLIPLVPASSTHATLATMQPRPPFQQGLALI